MDGKDSKKRLRFMNKITKIYLPIILTIYIIFNIPFIPSPLGSNTNLNFQPASASGEAYFFTERHFKTPNKNRNNNGDINITVWVLFFIILLIIGFVYFIFRGINNDKEQENKNAQDKTDYIELLKDDSDFEGNI